jgi:hypothetical protein
VEFPPLLFPLDSAKPKSSLDDFDNVQELTANADLLLTLLPLSPLFKDSLLLFPDLRECEEARKRFPGKMFAPYTYSTIAAAAKHYDEGSYAIPWGERIVSLVNPSSLGDPKVLSPLPPPAPPTLAFAVQPGNAGPVEDWLNLEPIQKATGASLVIINGALDKVTSGYYPRPFFPALAACSDRFYRDIEAAFYLKPVQAKGLYAWVYRVYGEPWQVVLQEEDDGEVTDVVCWQGERKPSYEECVRAMLDAGGGEEGWKKREREEFI